MKEATGELNMTVITVVAIAAIAAFFYAFVWPAIKRNIERNTHCASAVCEPCSDKMCDCIYIDDNNAETTIQCPAQND